MDLANALSANLNAAPTAIVLVDTDTSPQWAERICGLSVLARVVAALARARVPVFVPAFSRLDAGLQASLRAELGRMPRTPVVHFDALPPSASDLIVVTAPGVFDARILERLSPAAEGERGRVIAFGRGSLSGPAFLWYLDAAGASAAAAVATLPPAEVQARLVAATSAALDPGRELCDALATNPAEAIEAKLIELGRKSSDTWVARSVDRRVSLWLTRRLVEFSVTPNQITIAATLLGLLGAALLLVGTYFSQLIGALLLTASIIGDGCDGEVARIKFMESEFGRKLDFFLDNVVNVAAIFSVGAGYAWQSGESFYFYASVVNGLAAAAAVLPVYSLFFREAKQAVRLDLPAARDPSRSWTAVDLIEGIAGRDFAYLILVLALFGRAHWFALACLAGILVFLAAVVILVVRDRFGSSSSFPIR